MNVDPFLSTIHMEGPPESLVIKVHRHPLYCSIASTKPMHLLVLTSQQVLAQSLLAAQEKVSGRPLLSTGEVEVPSKFG